MLWNHIFRVVAVDSCEQVHVLKNVDRHQPASQQTITRPQALMTKFLFSLITAHYLTAYDSSEFSAKEINPFHTAPLTISVSATMDAFVNHNKPSSMEDRRSKEAKMRRRFNKSAAAVRARMAQKCKDERRFGRVLPPGCINQPSAVTSGRYSSRSPGVSSSRRRNAVGSARSQRGTGDLRASPRRNQRPPQTPPSATVSKVTGCSGSNSSNSNSSSGNGYFSSCGYGLYPPTSGGVAMPPSAPGLHVSSPHPVHMVSSPPALGVHDPPVILASATEMAG
ncbi:unnamed protein product [Schistocephalus solidus]|uniref:Nuclear transcription factor Y subunit n=1 Tax=Schistocephalus solidus TaxID=70667 RepID=A0A183TBL2_SCHSO|nr:unnamed protein product [Schistocephalus solidus]